MFQIKIKRTLWDWPMSYVLMYCVIEHIMISGNSHIFKLFIDAQFIDPFVVRIIPCVYSQSLTELFMFSKYIFVAFKIKNNECFKLV
jgi:hypothetical protein